MQGFAFQEKGKEMALKSTSRLKRIVLRGALVVLLICVVAIALICLWTELYVKKMCEMATREYPGAKVEA